VLKEGRLLGVRLVIDGKPKGEVIPLFHRPLRVSYSIQIPKMIPAQN
jgi:hypothetical protein